MILRQDDLTAAADDGIISAEQARALSEFAAQRRTRPRPSNERFIVVNNFAEVFICVGQIMAASAISTYAGFAGAERAPTVYLAAALLSWLMAEVFVYRKPRLAPAVLAALMVVYFTVSAYTAATGGEAAPKGVVGAITDQLDAASIALSALLASFLRFRLPFLLLPTGLVFTAVMFRAAGGLFPDLAFHWIIAGCGLSLLALAIWLDTRDPLRQSRVNDFAFWLFVLGSPMTIHPLFASAILTSEDWGSMTFLIAGCALGTSFVGLVLDRRSLIASSLLYITIAIGYASFDSQLGFIGPVFFAPLVVGISVILLGVFWYPVRSALLKRLPLNPLLRHVPPLS